jgi:hypothetical protein
MNVYKYLDSKVVYCRAHHLLQGFEPFLTPEELITCEHDVVRIATLERDLGYLQYITVSVSG